MKSEDCLNFNPDVIGVFFKKLEDTLFLYMNYYFAKLDNIKVNVFASAFQEQKRQFDVVLTSPPYGDSRTTVAYGQFSTFSNEWLGIKKARSLDKQLMGGVQARSHSDNGLIADYIAQIRKIDNKRSLDVSAFYRDLELSIKNVATGIKKGGKAIYVVGNRTVKGVQLPTDQFIAEKFEESGFRHLITYQRLISNKAMPSKNSPSNIPGKTANTMLFEYIVVCEKGI
jgi:predicted RNA methylase